MSPEPNRINWTIRLVLNLTLRPKPISREYLFPSSLWKNRKEDKSFEPFATSQTRAIKEG